VRSWRRAAERRRRKLPKCVHCEKPIPRSEPDVTLERLGSAGGSLMFHERCGLDAYKALIGGESGAWRVVHRHIDAEAN
jgi:hypothetical protein